jgi:16S rRNA (adenine1518-N6/adenine1519-N6)-dimethyltransferase
MDLKQIAVTAMKERGFYAKRSLGQNFLINESVLEHEAAFGDIEGKDVIEIGPGLGFLTQKLAQRAKKVLAIEKDTSLKPYLERYLEGCDNVEIVWGDALEVDLPKYKVVSNIPYQISSPLTFKLLYNGNPAVICYQKEFAQRMLARAGTKEYSRLSATIGFLATVKKLREVPKGNFWPQPQVDSMIVDIIPHQKPRDWDRIKALIDKIFPYPNKKMSAIAKITGIRVPEALKDKRVREMSTELLVLVVNYLN